MKVLLVEDHEGTRAAVAAVLGQHGLEVVTAASLDDVDVSQPIDAALIDLNLGERSGLELIQILAARDVPCLVLTQFDDASTLIRALKTGARGYLLKTDPPELIVTALHQATTGQVPLSAQMTHHLLPEVSSVPEYVLEIDSDLSWAHLNHRQRRRSFRSETQVALLYALGRHWKQASESWLDNRTLSVAIWGRQHLTQHPNNLNVLMHRLRRAAQDAGLVEDFLQNRDGRSRLLLAEVHIR